MKTRYSEGMHRPNGFTMIEILIVMVIIGILTTLLATNLATSQERARDAKRRADVKAMQNAFEQYFLDNATYAADCATMGTAEYLPMGAAVDPATNVPYSDPSTCQSAVTGYCACAQLERNDGNATALPITPACSYAQSGDRPFYCLSNVQ